MNDFTPPPRTSTGLGKLFSLFTFICLFTAFPAAIKKIWPYFLNAFEEPYLYIAMVFSANIIVIGLYNITMYFVYRAKHPFFEKYRSSSRPWPWEEDYEKWKLTLKRTLKTVFFNMFILNCILPFFEYYTGGIKYKASLEEWPTPQTMLLQFIFFMLLEDVLFYWSHSTLHRPSFYWIHKKHHEYNTTVTIAATYAHPIEYMLGNAVPFGLGYHLLAKFTPVHYMTILVWFVFRLMETCEGHSGYDWSWGQLSFIRWKLGPDYHNFHHSHNIGNFGSMFGFWDTLMGTNKEYRKYIQKKEGLKNL